MTATHDDRSALVGRVLDGLRHYPGVLRTVNDTVARHHDLGPTDGEARCSSWTPRTVAGPGTRPSSPRPSV